MRRAGKKAPVPAQLIRRIGLSGQRVHDGYVPSVAADTFNLTRGCAGAQVHSYTFLCLVVNHAPRLQLEPRQAASGHDLTRHAQQESLVQPRRRPLREVVTRVW